MVIWTSRKTLGDQVRPEGVCISAVSATHTVYAFVPHPCLSLLPLTVTSVIIAFAVFLDPKSHCPTSCFYPKDWLRRYTVHALTLLCWGGALVSCLAAQSPCPLPCSGSSRSLLYFLTLQVCVKVGKDSPVKAN